MSGLWHEAYVALSGIEDWLRAHEDFTRGTFLVVAAWALTSWAQRRSKSWEFRAQTLKDVSSAYNRVFFLAIKVQSAIETVEVKPDPIEVAKITDADVTLYKGAFRPGDYWIEYFEAHQECSALEPVLELHFRGKAVIKHFQSALRYLSGATNPKLSKEARSDSVKKARVAWREFVLSAGIEVGVNTWWRRLKRKVRSRWRRFRKQPVDE